MSNTLLAKKVILKIENSKALKEELETDRICWSTTYVKIQGTLNEALPNMYEEVEYGVRKLTETEYLNRLRKWYENKVNGRVVYIRESKKVNDRVTYVGKSDKIEWVPPEGSHLYRLTQHTHLESSNKQPCEYYLLYHEEGYFFLKKKFGKGRENSLRILTGECSDQQFTETLSKFI